MPIIKQRKYLFIKENPFSKKLDFQLLSETNSVPDGFVKSNTYIEEEVDDWHADLTKEIK